MINLRNAAGGHCGQRSIDFGIAVNISYIWMSMGDTGSVWSRCTGGAIY